MATFPKIRNPQIRTIGLAGKLSGMVSLIALFVYVPSILIGAWSNLKIEKQSLEEYKRTLEMRVQNVFEPAIWNYDIETLSKLISTELKNRNLKSLRISSEGKNMVWLSSQGATVYTETKEPAGRYIDKRTVSILKLNVRNQVLATATLWYDHSESRSRFFRKLVIEIVETGLIIIMIGAGITISSYISLVRPLESIRISMIEAGKSSHRLARKRIEVANFKKAFSEIKRMGLDLDHMLADIDELNNELEAKVISRTLELENAKHELEVTIEDLKATQAQLISHEKMAALGQLISGIAHELNTPMGVVSSAGGTLESIIQYDFDRIVDFRVNAPQEAIRFYEALLIKSSEETKPDVQMKRQLKNRYYRAADERGLSVYNEIIEHLADIGYDADEEEFAELISQPWAAEAVDAAYRVVSMKKAIRMIKISAEKASHVVSALKTYARRDANQSVVPHDIIKDIEMVLTLYNNQTKYGVEIARDYADVPPVLCFPEKLHQVWVNIINNALQAMNYKGKLIISVKPAGGCVKVSITDSGPGIPLQLQERIFEPFFTTKRLGEGTGLGLDIVKRTLDEIGGRVEVDSIPGRTTFHIFLKNAVGGDCSV